MKTVIQALLILAIVQLGACASTQSKTVEKNLRIEEYETGGFHQKKQFISQDALVEGLAREGSLTDAEHETITSMEPNPVLGGLAVAAGLGGAVLCGGIIIVSSNSYLGGSSAGVTLGLMGLVGSILLVRYGVSEDGDPVPLIRQGIERHNDRIKNSGMGDLSFEWKARF